MIKKILFGFALLASVTACTEDYTDWGEPQKNAQEELLSFGDGSVAAVGVIDFAEIAEGQELVQVCSITAPSASDAEYAPEYLLTIGGTDFEINAAGQVSVAALQDYVNNTFGRRPTEREMAATISMWLNNGATSVKQASATFKITAKPVAPQISEKYYLIGGVEGTSWNVDDMSLPFSHSGKDVYDDPVFTVTFPVEDGEYWFAFTDAISIAAYEATGDWSQVLGCAEGNGKNGMEGKVARRAEIGDDGSFVVTVNGDAKFIRFTLNMMDYSYTIEKVNFAAYIYEVGNNNAWGDGYAMQGLNYDGIYYGAMYLVSGFKFRADVSEWSETGNWGANENRDEGVLIDSGSSSDISLAEEGHYLIKVDLVNMTYTLTPYTELGIIGDGQPGGWDNDTPLTYDEEEKCWHAEGVQLTAGKSIKFRTVGTWEVVNIGGSSLSNLVFNSNDNIPVEKDGVFTVKLYLETQGEPYATLIEE